MKDKVKLSYTIPLDEVPMEISRLLAQRNSRLGLKEQMVELQNALCSPDLAIGVIEKIESIRDFMIDLDLALAESQEVLSGYFQIVMAGNKAAKTSVKSVNEDEFEEIEDEMEAGAEQELDKLGR